jgi:8-oxo-dGTP pyrophosphatase MutT (NUDIX family)
MRDEWPKIRSRRVIEVSPWMKIVEREVELAPGKTELYHAVSQADYVAIVACTPARGIVLVRQYRPALEDFTWELPAGLVDAGEDPSLTCARELLEETGFPARAVHALGATAPCTGRLSNRIHSFFVETAEQVDGFVPEPGMSVRVVSEAELGAIIARGEFISQLHLGALLLAERRALLHFAR